MFDPILTPSEVQGIAARGAPMSAVSAGEKMDLSLLSAGWECHCGTSRRGASSIDHLSGALDGERDDD